MMPMAIRYAIMPRKSVEIPAMKSRNRQAVVLHSKGELERPCRTVQLKSECRSGIFVNTCHECFSDRDFCATAFLLPMAAGGCAAFHQAYTARYRIAYVTFSLMVAWKVYSL